MDRNIIFFDVETNGKIGSSVLSISAMKKKNGLKYQNITGFILGMKGNQLILEQ